MGNQAYVSVNNAKDQIVARGVASLADGVNSLATPGRYCQFICQPSGEAIGYGYISIPIKALADELAPTVALRADGPTGSVKLGTRASLGYGENGQVTSLLNGTLVSYVHNFGDDSALGVVLDDRWLLSKISTFGRMVYDPIEKTHYFDATQRLIFNELGWPSCLETPFGPRFAPCYRYGYKAQFGSMEDLIEPTPGNAQNRCRSWTCGDVLQYLRDAHYSGEGVHRPKDITYYGNHFLGQSFVWPVAVSGVVGNTRVLNHFDIQNDSLLQALQKTARKAGAYDILVRPSGSSKSVLSLVDMGSRDKEGSYIYTPDQLDQNQLLTTNDTLQAGYIKEDISNYFSETVIIGDPPAEERMLSTASGGTGAGGLEPAWDRGTDDSGNPLPMDQKASDSSDEGLFLKYLKDNGKTQVVFECATHIFPLVFCAYRIKRGYRLWTGTKYDGQSNQGAHAAMRPVLLTGAQQNSNNPANFLPREVVVEWAKVANDPDQDSSWSPANRYDNLTLSPDGQILYLSALRDSTPAQTWDSTGGATFDPDNIKPNNIRLTIAANADWSLTGVNQADPNGTNARVNGKLNFSYQSVAEPLDYVEYLRGGGADKSWPDGKAAFKDGNGNQTAQSKFPDRCVTGNELFSDVANGPDGNPGRLPRHASVRQVDVRRVANSGQIVQAKLNPSIAPGMAISVFSAVPIKVNSICKSVTWDFNAQNTTIELQAADQAVIYDLPMPASYTNMSPASAGKTDQTPGYLDEDNYSYGNTSGKNKTDAGADVSPGDAEGSNGPGRVNDIDDEPRRTSSTRGAGRASDGNADAEQPSEKRSTIKLDGQDFDPAKKDKGATLEGRRMTPEAPPTPGIREDGQVFRRPPAEQSLDGKPLPQVTPPTPGITSEGKPFQNEARADNFNGHEIPKAPGASTPVIKTPGMKPIKQNTRAQNIKEENETD